MTAHSTLDPVRLPGLVLRDHVFELPLDYARPERGELKVFAREVRGADDAEKPWLVFFQGGPGFESPRPGASSGWIGRALEDYRVLLLDQRGTGRSSQVDQRLAHCFEGASELAEYLTHFRADAIIKDAEAIRQQLTGGTPWTVLGQSFGGFCVTHYLSVAPAGLAAALITGGLPPLAEHCDAVYRRTFATLLDKHRAYYARYPVDVERIRALVQVLSDEEVVLPCGDTLTPRRFAQLGLHLGMSDGFETLHYLVELAFAHGDEPSLGTPFLRGFENALSYDTNPLFSVLHEACYAHGSATNWSAQRVLSEFPQFETRSEPAFLFTGEMIFPWMFTECSALAPFREAAELLAQKNDWPQLYDPSVLERNEVPCAAAIYANDMYVDRQFSEETAKRIRGLRPWLTDEYEHNGLRADGARVLGRLLDLVNGRA